MAITMKPINKQKVTMTISGISPMLQHQWDEKNRKQMEDKHAGKKTKDREVRNPQAEFEAAMYRTQDGGYGLPAMSVKAAMIAAAHKDIGIEKTMLRKALFLHCDDPNNILTMDCDEPELRQDYVRVGNGKTDLRYRPEFKRWSAVISFTFDAELLQVEDIVNLLDRAGFGCGVGDWRPQKGGEFGRFQVDTTQPITSGAV